MSDVGEIPRARRWLPLAVLLLLLVTALFVWRALPPPSSELVVINLGDEVVELELYGSGLERPAATGQLLPRQRVSLPLALRSEGELRLHAVSPRAAVDALLLPQAKQLREASLQLEVRDGAHYVLAPAD